MRPTALPDSVLTDRNTAVTIPVLANDLGFGNPVTVTIPAGPVHGTALVNGSARAAGRRLDYLHPDGELHGLDTFTYRVSDGVNAEHDDGDRPGQAPEAANDQAVVIRNTPKAIAVLSNDVGFTIR